MTELENLVQLLELFPDHTERRLLASGALYRQQRVQVDPLP